VAAAGLGALAGTAFAPLRPVHRASIPSALLVAHFAGVGIVVYLLYLPIFAMADDLR
jgi:hypothetical protein